MFDLGLTEAVLISLVAFGALAVCAMFAVGLVLIVRPLVRPKDAASNGRSA